jgi:hypothetical protein
LPWINTNQNACHFILEEKYQQKVTKGEQSKKIKETKQQSSSRGKFYPEITYYTEDFGYWTVFCTLQTTYIFLVVSVDHTFQIHVQYIFLMVTTHRQNKLMLKRWY